MSVAAQGIDRIAAAFASHGKRAALMPYLMGGYPSLDASADAGLAAAAAGADLIELGIPFSDPLADGPVIHAAGTEALAGGATPHGTLRGVCELEGIIPALESSHAVTWALRGDAGPDTLDLVCLSGRGDKDLAEVLPKLGLVQ